MNNKHQNIDPLEFGKIPPQAIEIEEALLGAILVDSNTAELIDKIFPEMFYNNQHQIIFKAISELRKDKNAIDLLTVINSLKASGKLEEVGGALYLTKLSGKVSYGFHANEHYLIILQKYIFREIIKQSTELINIAYESDEIEEAQSKIEILLKFVMDSISGDIHGRILLDIAKDSIDKAFRRMEELKEGKEIGISTGIGALQDITGGWQKKDLIYIAGRPSMGKTSISIHLAKKAASKGFRTLFFSLEMSEIAITDRAILGETEIDPEKWRNGHIYEQQFSEIDGIRKIIQNWPLIIYDQSSLRPSDILSICKKEKPDIVFIDYIQLMKPNRGEKYENKNLSLGSISHELKAIAKEMDIPVIALSQLSREVEKRGSKMPILADLRESGDLEQDADLIIFPFRPYVYSQQEQEKWVIQYIIAKHRNGRIGIVEGKHNKFMNKFFDTNNDNLMPIEINEFNGETF